MSILFASKGSYLRNWIKKDGSYQYGSIQPEAKEGLKELRRLYKEGTLDNQFLFRADNNIEELIKDGKCGIFFGEWWSGDNPLMQARSKNKDADWRPYLIETDSDGKTSYVQQNPVGKYVVVRKGFEHPEIVIKMHNVLFNKLQQEDSQLNEIAQYYKRNVDPTARPCSINVDYENALERSYENIQDYFICIAKTQYSLSSNPNDLNVPKNIKVEIKDYSINHAAKMIVLLCDNIYRMPGLNKEPRAKNFK